MVVSDLLVQNAYGIDVGLAVQPSCFLAVLDSWKKQGTFAYTDYDTWL